MPYIAARALKLSGRQFSPGEELPPLEREITRTLLSVGYIVFEVEAEREEKRTAQPRRKVA